MARHEALLIPKTNASRAELAPLLSLLDKARRNKLRSTNLEAPSKRRSTNPARAQQGKSPASSAPATCQRLTRFAVAEVEHTRRIIAAVIFFRVGILPRLRVRDHPPQAGLVSSTQRFYRTQGSVDGTNPACVFVFLRLTPS
ncbi:MAG: hypothetical protein WKF61_05150 [Luteimonas sp.]